MAIEYQNIGGRPAMPRQDNPRSESIFIHTATAGAVLNEAVDVINNTKIQKTLMVYGADSTPASGGGFACEQFLEEKNDVGSWISLEQDVVDVPSMSKIKVPFTISIPPDLDAGEYNGCILIQEKKAPEKKEGGMNLAMRTGLRVALTIPGDIIRRLKIEEFVVSDKNKPKIKLRTLVANEGNVSVDADVEIVTKNILNNIINKVDSNYLVLKKQTSEWNFEMARPMWGGRFQSHLVVRYYQDQEKTDQVTLDGPTVTFYTWPTRNGAIIEGGAVALIFGFITYIVWGIKRQRYVEKHWRMYTVNKHDDIQNIAKKHHTSWRKLAKVNRLKPPYHLRAGQSIKVPPNK